MSEPTSAQQNLGALAKGEAPVLEQLAEMTVNTFERSGLDPQTYLLVRFAALVAMDAAPLQYVAHIGAAGVADVKLEQLQGTLVAIAPLVGSVRVMSAAGKVLRGLGLAAAIEEEMEYE
jgi:4-carboxymuconolactone decarboxylase